MSAAVLKRTDDGLRAVLWVDGDPVSAEDFADDDFDEAAAWARVELDFTRIRPDGCNRL